jgi:hypothetical protein
MLSQYARQRSPDVEAYQRVRNAIDQNVDAMTAG